MLRFVLSIALVLTIVNSSPVERKNGQVVIDVPAGLFDPPSESGEKIEEPKINKNGRVGVGEVEIVPVKVKDTETVGDSSIEDIDVRPPLNRENFFGFQLPQLFVYRRPVISDPFSSFGSFPSFQQRPHQVFTPAQPVSQFNVMSHMEAMMKRMQEQMSSLWGSVLNPNYNRPLFQQRPTFPVDSSLSGSESSEKDVLNLDNLPANYSNSTSETKVVDGQLLTVNKTVHRFSSNDSSGFFHVQVINIRPQSVPTAAPSAIPTEVTSGSSPTASGVKSDSDKAPSSAHSEEAVVPTTTFKTEDPSMNEIDEPQQKQEVSGVDQGLLDDDQNKKQA